MGLRFYLTAIGDSAEWGDCASAEPRHEILPGRDAP